MNTLLLEPTDVLFFRGGIPMSAGQGRGAGCRLPFPGTVHEAFRHTLLMMTGRETHGKFFKGRKEKFIGSFDFQGLRTLGPLPWLEKDARGQPVGAVFPVPLDAVKNPDDGMVAHLKVIPYDPALRHAPSEAFVPAALPAPTVRPHKENVLRGWWTAARLRRYLANDDTGSPPEVISKEKLWFAEDRVGVSLTPEHQSAADGQLFAGSWLRPQCGLRFLVRTHLPKPRGTESADLERLINKEKYLLLGGDRRLARIHYEPDAWPAFPAPEVPGNISEMCLVRWVLLTPALFSYGSTPGWCWPQVNSPLAHLPRGRVCLRNDGDAAPPRAVLIAHALGRAEPVSGWDTLEQRPKPTQLAVPAGSVYYFACATPGDASRLIALLHDRTRSDFFGEKGCGHGLCATPEPMSADLQEVAQPLLVA